MLAMPDGRIIELSEAEITGLKKTWRISRLVAELDSRGVANRELGYDDLGRVSHRWPDGESLASRGVLDLATFVTGKSSISQAEFNTLWQRAIEEEEFFPENDPFGDRFALEMPRWGCFALMAIFALAIYVLLR